MGSDLLSVQFTYAYPRHAMMPTAVTKRPKRTSFVCCFFLLCLATLDSFQEMSRASPDTKERNNTRKKERQNERKNARGSRLGLSRSRPMYTLKTRPRRPARGLFIFCESACGLHISCVFIFCENARGYSCFLYLYFVRMPVGYLYLVY